MSAIGQKIQAYRERRHMTQQELARKVRVGTQTIERYESGEKLPGTDVILKISTVLDIPACELLENTFCNNQSGIDDDIQQLIKEIGAEKAKLILRKSKEGSEEDFLYL